MGFDFGSYFDGRMDQKRATKMSGQIPSGISAPVADSLMHTDILFLKKRLAATRAVRDALQDALKEVAPNHPLLSPDSDRLSEVGRSAADQITSPNDKI